MCLGVPGKVVAIDGMSATVDFFGVRKELRLDIVDEPVSVGDYVLNHVGFAIRRIPPDEVQETLALFDQILDVSGAKADLMAEDVRGEIAAAKTSADCGAPSLAALGAGGRRGEGMSGKDLFQELKFRDPVRARALSDAIAHEVAAIGRPVSVMHVCGSHEQAIARFGLRAVHAELESWARAARCA